MIKAKVSDILSEIFKKIGSKENTKEVTLQLGKVLSNVVGSNKAEHWHELYLIYCISNREQSMSSPRK